MAGEGTVTTRELILNILETLESCGRMLYTSIGQNDHKKSRADDYGGHYEGYGATDSWYCMRQKSWIPGSAIVY